LKNYCSRQIKNRKVETKVQRAINKMTEKMKEEIDFKDEELKCFDCEATFIFSKGEAIYFYSKGLRKPKRCPSCRLKRKLTISPPDDGVSQ
jgi:hypothetical protein